MIQELNHLFTFDYDAELECGILIWQDCVFSFEYRLINEHFLEFIDGRPFTKMIRDVRRLCVTTTQDQQWFMQTIAPKLLAMGLQYSANIVSNDKLEHLLVKGIIERVRAKDITTGYFDDIKQAKEWLREVS